MSEIDSSLRLKIIKFANFVNQAFSVVGLYVYGSTVHGTADEWSDVDIAVILDEEEAHSWEIYALGKDFDITFDALGFTKNEFDHTRLPILREIQKTGVQII